MRGEQEPADTPRWRKRMEAQFRNLQTAIFEIQKALNLPKLIPAQAFDIEAGMPRNFSFTKGVGSQARSIRPKDPSTTRQTDVTAMTRENSPEATVIDDEDEGIVNAPMASLFEVTKLRNIRSNPGATNPSPMTQIRELDFISQGKVSCQEAERLFSTFKETLDAYLWGGIALVHKTLEATRSSSTLLTAAVLAVTALHAEDEGRCFDICYPIFLELTSQSVLARYHTLDDIRGLCIGAFWLSDLSWKLSGLAVRIATELNIHQFCAKAVKSGSAEHLEKTRLWYFLYVCDHHFSIAYGRPPVINEDATIISHEKLLQLPVIAQPDLRLHSQVTISIILSRAFHTFGSDRSQLVANDEFHGLRRYDMDLSLWRSHWEARLAPDEHISQYPAKGVVLHYHFARLQLFSICLRGLNPSGEYALSSERRDFVNTTITSASSALSLNLDDPNMGKAVIGVPLYLLTTIAYASMFLLKVQSKWKLANFDIHYDEVVALIERIVTLLSDTQRSIRHLAPYIGRGLNNILQRLKEQEAKSQQQQDSHQSIAGPWAEANAWQDQDWNSWMFGGDGDVMEQAGTGQDYYPLNMLDVLNSQMPF
ncbi:Fc.00g103900.m01.CDS01 [Cosmosporella sp. VM-42]